MTTKTRTSKTAEADAIVARAATLTQIAANHLHMSTLATRNNDSADFYDIAVWSIKAALEAAYEAGRAAAAK